MASLDLRGLINMYIIYIYRHFSTKTTESKKQAYNKGVEVQFLIHSILKQIAKRFRGDMFIITSFLLHRQTDNSIEENLVNSHHELGTKSTTEFFSANMCHTQYFY